jgi:hypothetical protein
MTMASEIVNTSGQTQRAAETFRTDTSRSSGLIEQVVVFDRR